jgi:hypothetical protein
MGALRQGVRESEESEKVYPRGPRVVFQGLLQGGTHSIHRTEHISPSEIHVTIQNHDIPC